MTRNSKHWLVLIGALTFSGLHAGSARASDSYPQKVQTAAGSPCPPPCTVCHLTTNGGTGTALKPFAESMIDFGGLEGEDADLVAPAVQSLRDEQIDSDGDGVSDIDELAAGRDPNVTGEGELCGPTYGCGARVEPEGPIDGYAIAAALAAVALLVGRWRSGAR